MGEAQKFRPEKNHLKLKIRPMRPMAKKSLGKRIKSMFHSSHSIQDKKNAMPKTWSSSSSYGPHWWEEKMSTGGKQINCVHDQCILVDFAFYSIIFNVRFITLTPSPNLNLMFFVIKNPFPQVFVILWKRDCIAKSNHQRNVGRCY